MAIMDYAIKRLFYLLLATAFLFLNEAGIAAEKRLSKGDTPSIRILMKKMERDTQMFEDALEIGDMEELNRLADELCHTSCQVCTVVTDSLSESEAKEFRKRAETFYASMQTLMVFTRQATLPMVTSHYQEVKESCQACHQVFKK